MHTSDIKKQLHAYIDMIEDEDQLEILNEAAHAYATQQPDILDLLTPEQLEGLKEAIKQADNGETVPHEQVMKLAKEWMEKKSK